MPRRGENIYKRRDKRWEGRFIAARKPDGKAVYHSVYGHSYAEVREKLRENIKKHNFCLQGENNTFAFYCRQWLDTAKLKCKPSTQNTYYNICRLHILPQIGEIEIKQISILHINRLLSEKSSLAPKTLSDILRVIKAILSFAESCGCAAPINLQSISVRVPSQSMRVLSVEEQKRLTMVLLENNSLYGMGIFLALSTGIRIGELCALKRCDLSFDDNTLHVGETMQRIQMHDSNHSPKTKVIFTEPKSKKSIRDIPLTAELVKLIKPFYYSLSENAYLVSGEANHFVEPRSLQYHFKKLAKAAGIENLNFHALRHSFATRCVECGVDVKTLSELLGHESVKFTLEKYVHSSMSLKRENMEKFSSYVFD